MEAGKFSITGRGKTKESKVDQSQDKDAVYSVVSHMERTLFIVDLSKLEAEGDALVDALVMYRPAHEFRKVICSLIEDFKKLQALLHDPLGPCHLWAL